MPAPIQLLFDLGLEDLNPIEVGEHNTPSNNFVRPKSFNGVIIHHIRSGWGDFTLYGKHYRVGPGQAFLILPGQERDVHYTADHDDPWEYAWVSFTGKLAHRFSVLPPVFDTPKGSFPNTYDLRNATDSIGYLIAADLYALYAHLVSPHFQKTDYIGMIRARIDEAYGQKLTVEGFAAQYGLDRRHLSRMFKKQTGTTIRAYLTQVRINRAGELLMQDLSAKEIAFACGFGSTSNFHKIFTAHYGLTPMEWKLQQKT